MIFKGIFILSLFLMGIGSWADSALAKSKNSGLGPLELRNQYPVTHQFLSLHPENTATQKKREIQTELSHRGCKYICEHPRTQ